MSQSTIDPAEIEAYRLQLRAAGFAPIPITGKAPLLKDWQKLGDATEHQIKGWSRVCPAATNTGMLTRTTPSLDVDILDPEAAEAVERLARERYEDRGVVLVRIGRSPKRAFPFRADTPFTKITINLIGPLGPEAGEKLEFLGEGQQIVVAGIHPDIGKPYSWRGGRPGEDFALEDLPPINVAEARELVTDAAELLIRDFGYARKGPPPKSNGNGQDRDDTPADWICDFSDHDALAALAMRLVKSGMHDGAVVAFLRAQVTALTNIDPDRKARRLKEIPRLVESARDKLDADEAPAQPAAQPTSLDLAVKVFEKWLLLDDSWPVYVTLGAIAANHLPGPPVWLGLIAPPSSAKTEILSAMLRLPKVELVTTASPAALLSGTPKKQAAKGAKGGLLSQIGPFGILVLKDFTSVLGLHRDSLSEMLDALREIYDGKWVRHLGTDGGRTLKWEGKLGLIFGCTEAYDSHYAIIGVLGDRFLLYRLPPSQHDQFEMAMLHSGERFKMMQDELAAAAAGLFAGLGDPLPSPRAMNAEESLRIKRKVILACHLRAGVNRDRYSRELEAVYGAEGAGRLGLSLERLLAGLDVIGIERETAMQIVEKTALDSVPPIRRKVYEELAGGRPKTTREVAAAADLPTTTVRRALEDITAHGLATRNRVKNDDGKDGRDDEWTQVELAIFAAPKTAPTT
jgi:Bifunctional DNA primase/polymerase, N-terminal